MITPELILPVVDFIYRLSIKVDIFGVILVGLLTVGEYPPVMKLYIVVGV